MRIRGRHDGAFGRSSPRRLAAVLLGGACFTLIAPAPRAEAPPVMALGEPAPRGEPAPVAKVAFVPVQAPPTIRLVLPPMKSTPVKPAPAARVAVVPTAIPRTIRLVLPPVKPAFAIGEEPPTAPERPAPVRIAATLPIPAPLLDIRAPIAAPASPPALAARADPAELSPAAIAQISSPADSSPQVVQLHEPAGAMALALNERIAAMQVALPPVRVGSTERAALLAASPDRLQVRRGGEALGSVAFEVAASRAIAVRLGDVLDLVSADMPPEQFARLSQSAAAGTFVPLETLREAGIALRYDPVYDEFALGG